MQVRSPLSVVVVALAAVATTFIVTPAHARFNDNDYACSYSETSVSVSMQTSIEVFGGKANCRRSQTDPLHVPSFEPFEYEGTFSPVDGTTTEKVWSVWRGKELVSDVRGRCAVDPWINLEAVGPKGFRLVPACTDIVRNSGHAFGPADVNDRFPFMARFGAVPFGERKTRLNEVLAAQAAAKDGTKSFGAPEQPPQAVQAYVYALQGGKTGSVIWLLPKVDVGMWIDRFDVEVTFVPNRKGIDVVAATWYPEGTAAGRSKLIDSTTELNQYYATKKKDYYDSTDYWFRVCAVNNVGRTCATPVLARFETPNNQLMGLKGRTAPAGVMPSGTTLGSMPANGGKALDWGGGASPSVPSGGGSALRATPGAMAGALSAGLPAPGAAVAVQKVTPGQAVAAQKVLPAPTAATTLAAATSPQVATPTPTKPLQNLVPEGDNSNYRIKGDQKTLPTPNPDGSSPGRTSTTTATQLARPIGPLAKPNPPLEVKMHVVQGNPNVSVVYWTIPDQSGKRTIEKFRVLLCPKDGGGFICGGDLVEVALPHFTTAEGTGSEVPATAPWRGSQSPVVKAQVCSINAAGQVCAEPIAVSYWLAPAAADSMQVKRTPAATGVMQLRP